MTVLWITTRCLTVYIAPRLSINGQMVDSVTNVIIEPQFHVKENAGNITLSIRLEYLPVNKSNLSIEYYTKQSSACK